MSSSKDYIGVLINIGNVLYKLSFYEKTKEARDKLCEEALAIFKRVLNTASDNEQKMEGLYRVIQLEKILGNADQAKRTYDKYCNQEQLCNPNNPDRFMTIAMIEEELGNESNAYEFWDRARKHLSGKIKNEPENVKAFLDLSQVEVKLEGFTETVLGYYEQALEISPDSGKILYEKANTLANLERYDEALETYEQVLEKQPDNYNAWYHKAAILLKFKVHLPEGQFNKTLAKKAFDALEETTRLNPIWAEGWYLKATALYYLDKNQEALQSVEEAITLNPNFDRAWNLKGYILQDLGDEKGAEECFKEVERITKSKKRD